MFNHSDYYSLSWLKNPLTKAPDLVNNNQALAKSSVSNWRCYAVVTQARHFQSVLFLCLQFPVYMVGCAWSFMLATPTCSTPTRTVCHPYWRKGGSSYLLTVGGYHA